jgi:hypothetical protein
LERRGYFNFIRSRIFSDFKKCGELDLWGNWDLFVFHSYYAWI